MFNRDYFYLTEVFKKDKGNRMLLIEKELVVELKYGKNLKALFVKIFLFIKERQNFVK